jgi:cation transport regulator ChaC
VSEARWIFGYGSLVWRPSFPFETRRPAYLLGWVRRFWQGSTDHRGLPGAPGRVVTLIAAPGERCDGLAYRVAPELVAQVLDGLDHRERGGYERRQVTLHFNGPGSPLADALLYRATSRNPNYLGPAGLPEIARQVRGASGPSGHNVDYVLRLARALRELGATDPHVFALEALLAPGASRSGAP